MDFLEQLRRPVAAELDNYRLLFEQTLTHEDDYLGRALDYVRSRKGKMMRPLMVLLIAKECGPIRPETLRAAVTLELLHTASLVHDDVVDESNMRRGMASTNAVYGNQIAVLVGDYILSQALYQAALTNSIEGVRIVAELGATLSEGEVYQLANIRNEKADEEAYFHIIHRKTAALFAACGELAARTAGADDAMVRAAKDFGRDLGICFQIRDDIFDYFDDASIGKPTGNDMAEGKLTLPALHVLKTSDDSAIHATAARIKSGEATTEDIRYMVEAAKSGGGIAYAEQKMAEYRARAEQSLTAFTNAEVRESLQAFLAYVVDRNY